VVDHLIEQAITEAASVQGLFPDGHDHGWSWVEAARPRSLSDIDSPAVSDAGDHSSRDFGVPAWAGGRRPRRAARGGEMLQADRFRLRFSKDEPLRFSSHLEVTRAFRRAFRMSQLPVARSGGKDRRPKVSFGPPLPLGMTSGAEFLDVTFQREMPESFVRSLNQSLVEGLTVVACAPVRTEPDSLNSAIQIASYEVSFSDTVIEEYLGGIEFDDLKIRLEETLSEALASSEFLVTKVRGEVSRTFNARPSLRRADVVRDDGGRPALSMQLTLNRPDSVRPELLTATLVNWAKIDERLLRVHRSGLHIPGRNKDLDPLEVVAPGFRWWRQQVRKGTVL
jgi:radical SAM-linked protein